MKFILLVAFAIACIGVEVWASGVAQKCKEKEGVSEEDFEKLRVGEFNNDNANKNVMCFVKCVLDEFDALDGDVLKEDRFLQDFEPHFGERKTKEIYDSCKGEVGDGECETPFKIAICLRRMDEIFKI